MNRTETKGRLQLLDGQSLAWTRNGPERRSGTPTLLWLGGFRSDMNGGKAMALATAADARGWPCLRFDYFAHGGSTGDWEAASIGRWREDALSVIDSLTEGPLVLVGSSMGGWIACLAALARPERVKALALIAPAADFTEALMRPALGNAVLAEIERDGKWMQPSEFGGEYAITRRLLDEGRNWLILNGPVAIDRPVRILQGGEDPDVPWEHALKLAHAIKSRDVVFHLIKDGDHRLSRPQDLTRLVACVAELVGDDGAGQAQR